MHRVFSIMITGPLISTCKICIQFWKALDPLIFLSAEHRSHSFDTSWSRKHVVSTLFTILTHMIAVVCFNGASNLSLVFLLCGYFSRVFASISNFRWATIFFFFFSKFQASQSRQCTNWLSYSMTFMMWPKYKPHTCLHNFKYRKTS